MGWFNPIKGHYLTLGQIDKTLSVNASATGIVRGSLIYEDSGTWKLATATQATDATAYLYFALQPQTGLTAGMAGSIGQGVSQVWNGSSMTTATAKVTGLAIGQPFDFETQEFDITQSYSDGDLLTVGANGRITKHTTGKNCIGQVIDGVSNRWVNDATAITGYKTGATVSILKARTLWLPLLATS